MDINKKDQCQWKLHLAQIKSIVSRSPALTSPWKLLTLTSIINLSSFWVTATIMCIMVNTFQTFSSYVKMSFLLKRLPSCLFSPRFISLLLISIIPRLIVLNIQCYKCLFTVLYSTSDHRFWGINYHTDLIHYCTLSQSHDSWYILLIEK